MMALAMRRGVALVALVLVGSVVVAAAEAEDRPPNVVMILADDMGFSDLGCYGGEVETPNLDRLAAKGLRFTQFYNTGRCWPSRAAFLTGYYAQEVNRDPGRLRPNWAVLLPDLLRRAGYRSYHSGKWHVDGPVLDGGFEHSYEISDHNRHFGPKVHHLDDEALPEVSEGEEYYSTRDIAKQAEHWLGVHEEEHGEEPFFLYVAFISPHFPIMALPEDIEKYQGRYDKGWDALREQRWKRQKEMGLFKGSFSLSVRDPKTIPGWNLEESKLKEKLGPGEVGYAVAWESLNEEEKAFQAKKMEIHAAMVDRIDQEVGRVLRKLEEMGELENTVILFASDNGASAEQIIRGDGHDRSLPPGSAGTFLSLGPGWSTASNTPFRLHKSWNHEGGVATPLIVHWPKGIEARGEYRRTPGHFIDLGPTLMELAGEPVPGCWNGEERPEWPGRSLVPAFEKDVAIERDYLFFKHTINRALRKGDWKIVATGKDAEWELYNLANDRGETHDLASKYPEKVEELAAIWREADARYKAEGDTAPKPKPKPKKVKKKKKEESKPKEEKEEKADESKSKC